MGTPTATNILGTVWDDSATSPALEELSDPASAGIAVLPKKLFLDLSTVPGVPGKIEGFGLIDEETLVIANDNDFDVGVLDADGNNVGAGVKCKLLIIDLPRRKKNEDQEEQGGKKRHDPGNDESADE